MCLCALCNVCMRMDMNSPMHSTITTPANTPELLASRDFSFHKLRTYIQKYLDKLCCYLVSVWELHRPAPNSGCWFCRYAPWPGQCNGPDYCLGNCGLWAGRFVELLSCMIHFDCIRLFPWLAGRPLAIIHVLLFAHNMTIYETGHGIQAGPAIPRVLYLDSMSSTNERKQNLEF